ncbi:hypothetical protein [Arsenicibacter rosenii]|nr:hypothetical protein [Arsenicibacter rosenii]
MNRISIWAHRHALPAIGLIILFETLNALLGVTIGAGVWTAEQPAAGLSPWVLHGLVALLVGVAAGMQDYGKIVGQLSRRMKHAGLFGAFTLNLCVFMACGAIWAERSQTLHPSGGLGSYSRIETISDSGRAVRTTENDYVREKALRQEKKANVFRTLLRRDDPPAGKDLTGTRIGYIFLFLLGLTLAYFSVPLACGLLCAEKAFLAALVFLLGTGVLSGGIYFLIRALKPDLTLYRDMARDERKREGRRYLRTWLATLGGVVLLGLLASVL